jgi:hypothetical protein
VASAQEPPEITGRWVQLQKTTAVSQITMVGEVVTETTALLLVDVTRDGDKLEMRELICSIDSKSSVDKITMTIPPAYMRAVSGKVRPVKLESRGGRWRYLQPSFSSVAGAKLAQLTDKLPTDKKDARVLDPDKDGHPGMTIQVRGIVDGDIYVIQRDKSEMTGMLSEAADRIEGSITWSVEQVVLGATSVFLSGQPPNSKQHPDSRRSSFTMVKVAPGISCASALKRRDELFR